MDLRDMVELLEDCRNTLMKEASKSCSDLDQEVGSKMEDDDQCLTPGHLIYKLRQQLIEKDNAIKRLGSEYDHNLSKVLSSLLFLEGKLHREQKHILRLMEQKDNVIAQQELQIKQLCKRIQILQSSIADFQAKMDSNGINQSLQDKCSPITPTDPTVNMCKRSDRYSNSEVPNSLSNANTGSITSINSNEGNSLFKHFSKPLRDKFTRHKSSVDLRSFKLLNEKDELCYRSMENIPQVVRREKKPRDKERCMSIAGYPNLEKFENDPELTAFMRNIHISNRTAQSSDNSAATNSLPPSRSNAREMMQHDKHDSKSTNIQLSKIKDDLPAARVAPPVVHIHAEPTQHTSHHSESNPFKIIRDTLKRKGSKQVKNKKQSFNLTQNPTKDTVKTLKFNEKHGNS